MTPPRELLQQVYWVCRPTRYPDRSDFLSAVQAYQDAIDPAGSQWAPDAVVLRCPRVSIGFNCWIGDEQPGLLFSVDADDGRQLTMGELFHKLCDGIGAALIEHDAALHDHCFFEGVSHLKEEDGAPLYLVHFGS